MSLSSLELWQRIAVEGIASTEQCRSWAVEVAQLLSPDELASGLKVLQRLVELKRLTNYQAKILAGQSTQPLRIGSRLVVRKLRDPIWGGWYELQNDSPSESPKRVWGRLLSQEELQQLRSSAPSLSRALKIAGTKSLNLQSSLSPDLVDGKLVVVVSPVVGSLLIEQFAQTACSPDQALGIVRQVAMALSALHEKESVHGRVLPDRVFLSGDHATLAIDPLCSSTATAESASLGILGQSLSGFSRAQFIAPEFLAPGQLSTKTTDVYSLGCLWWWLLTGQAPASVSMAEQALAQHSRALPSLPAECQLPEPQLRCLQHALARRPAARFASAAAFLKALEAALRAQPLLAESKGVAPMKADPQPIRAAKLLALSPPQPAAGSLAAVTQQPAATAEAKALGTARPRASRRRRRGNQWLIPVVGGCGFLIVLLAILKFSGVLQPGTAGSNNKPKPAYVSEAGGETRTTMPVDPRESVYQIVATEKNALWAPPAVPQPFAIDLLPPGGQLFLSLRTSAFQAGFPKKILATFDQALVTLLFHISERAGVPLEELAQVTVVFYPPEVAGQLPQFCVRCALTSLTDLAELKTKWNNPTIETIGERALLVGADALAYYIPAQPLDESQSVKAFSVGPLGLMRDVAEMQGGRGPLLTHMEKLWSSSDEQSDVAVFASPAFLFTEGRGLLAVAPPRLRDGLRELLGNDMRGAALQMRFEPSWYVETRLIGTSDQDAGKIVAKQQALVRGLPASIEQWLVSQSAHPYWRAIALRFPQMMRAFSDYSRFGVENGVAIMNTYLPSEAAANLLLASWIGLQDNATADVLAAQGPTPELQTSSLTVEEYLARPIRLSFDQEPIEVALRLVSEEANDKLPEGTSPLRFWLDGDAFEKAGITRNQQLRELKIDNLPVRDALTEIAKRGNPVTTVKDTHAEDQKLIWVVTPDPESPSSQMISLTTRAAAAAAGIALPSEF